MTQLPIPDPSALDAALSDTRPTPTPAPPPKGKVDGAAELTKLLDGAVPPRITDGVVVCDSMVQVLQLARHYVRAGMIPDSFRQPPSSTDEQIVRRVAVAIEYGLGVGFTPLQSLAYIYPINGRPCLWGDGPMSLVSAHKAYAGYDVKWEGENDTLTVVYRIGRKVAGGDTVWTEWKYTYADAKLAGLIGKGMAWPKHLRRMMFNRARAFAIRDAFPDALRGAGIAEEYTDEKAAEKAEAEDKTADLAAKVAAVTLTQA